MSHNNMPNKVFNYYLSEKTIIYIILNNCVL